MRCLARTLVMGCSLLLIPLAPASAPRSGEFPASFCPQCWRFLTTPDSIGKDGDCLACGKVAVGVDAAELTWTRCEIHDAWHERRCPEEGYRHDPPVRTALAIVVSPGDERLRSAAYCPECRSHPDPMKTEQGRCPACGGPLVAMTTLEPTWFWCAHRLHWTLEPCPGNGEKHCCVARRGSVPAKVRSGGGGAVTEGARDRR